MKERGKRRRSTNDDITSGLDLASFSIPYPVAKYGMEACISGASLVEERRLEKWWWRKSSNRLQSEKNAYWFCGRKSLLILRALCILFRAQVINDILLVQSLFIHLQLKVLLYILFHEHGQTETRVYRQNKSLAQSCEAPESFQDQTKKRRITKNPDLMRDVSCANELVFFLSIYMLPIGRFSVPPLNLPKISR